MDLHYLPGCGERDNWVAARGYTIEKSKSDGESVVVLGRITIDGVEGDYFVCRYTLDGHRYPGCSNMRCWSFGREAALKAYDARPASRRAPKIDEDDRALVTEYFDAQREVAE